MMKEGKKMNNVKLYADGAVLEDMVALYKTGHVDGFTTNPSLMKKAGVPNYNEFAQKVLAAIPDLPISFEVFADTLDEMEEEARIIASWGENVYVKIPIMTTKQILTLPLIEKLSRDGIKLNVTALFLADHIQATVDAFAEGTENIVSVFAGRIADTGRDPVAAMKEAVAICEQKPGAQLLWASTREVYNIIEAAEIGCDIITVPAAMIKTYEENKGKDLSVYTLETVEGFYRDSQSLGYTITNS